MTFSPVTVSRIRFRKLYQYFTFWNSAILEKRIFDRWGWQSRTKRTRPSAFEINKMKRMKLKKAIIDRPWIDTPPVHWKPSFFPYEHSKTGFIVIEHNFTRLHIEYRIFRALTDEISFIVSSNGGVFSMVFHAQRSPITKAFEVTY